MIVIVNSFARNIVDKNKKYDTIYLIVSNNHNTSC